MECNIYNELENSFVSDDNIRKIADQVLQSEQIDDGCMVSIHIISDEKMREYNKKYRGKDSTTDVLSFAAQEGISVKQEKKDLGDIFISLPQIIRQAEEYEVDKKEEFTRMLVHGILHLLGYDHQEEHEAKEMFGKQENIIKSIQ